MPGKNQYPGFVDVKTGSLTLFEKLVYHFLRKCLKRASSPTNFEES